MVDNKRSYICRQYNDTKITCRVQYTILPRPQQRNTSKLSRKTYFQTVQSHKQDILAAEQTFGPNMSTIKVQITRSRPTHVKKNDTPFPQEILVHHKDITLATCIIFLNKYSFLTTISKNIKVRIPDNVK